jgi:hypothetical protein
LLTQFNTQALKLSVLGVTLFAPSTYFGLNRSCITCQKLSHIHMNKLFDQVSFSPSFPATCPFVTAIGIPLSIIDAQLLSSLGGYSFFYGTPLWQMHFYRSNRYDSFGRGVPDLIYMSNHISSNHMFLLWDATITSAGALCIVNSEITSDVNSAGFVNPSLYSKHIQVSNGLTLSPVLLTLIFF